MDVRWATATDAAALCEVCRAAWQQSYTGIIPADQLKKMLDTRDRTWWSAACRTNSHLVVLTVDKRVKGYATCGPSRRPRRGAGEIYELYLAPVYQGIGLGQYLFESVRDILDRDNYRGLHVWALAANETAHAFYWSRGGRPISRTRERFGSVVLEKTCFAFA